jgi:FkbM family methyltransferase
MSTRCTFSNDNNVEILLTADPLSKWFINRDNHEVLFRRICTYLILNKTIKNNIIDLGAWIGDNSIPWAKNTSETIYSIDPSPENCSYISRMAVLNGINNIKILQTAISSTDETLITNGTLSHCTFVNQTVRDTSIRIPARSLDSLYKSGDISNIGFIHLDVEGMEYDVLIGSAYLIDECRPIIAFEQHIETEDYMQVCTYLSSKNYSVFLNEEILPGCHADCRNFFAFPYETMCTELIDDIHKSIGVRSLVKMG